MRDQFVEFYLHLPSHHVLEQCARFPLHGVVDTTVPTVPMCFPCARYSLPLLENLRESLRIRFPLVTCALPSLLIDSMFARMGSYC
jgi:hypothetical protein